MNRPESLIRIPFGLMAATAALVAQAPAAKPDPFAPLRFLEGDWEAADRSGTPGKAGQGAFSFRPELGGRALVRRSFAEVPAQGGRPGFRHEDLLTVYPEGEALKALYLDNEGHVIHYTVTAPAEGGVRFLSAGPGPRFRMVYRPAAAGLVDFAFDIAPPGQDFANYLKASLRRKP